MQQIVMYIKRNEVNEEYDLHKQDAHYLNTLVISKSLDSINYLNNITNSFGSH